MTKQTVPLSQYMCTFPLFLVPQVSHTEPDDTETEFKYLLPATVKAKLMGQVHRRKKAVYSSVDNLRRWVTLILKITLTALSSQLIIQDKRKVGNEESSRDFSANMQFDSAGHSVPDTNLALLWWTRESVHLVVTGNRNGKLAKTL